MYNHSHIFTVVLITILTCCAGYASWMASNGFVGIMSIGCGFFAVVGVIITGE